MCSNIIIDFWNQQHHKYATTDWINKPSLFAKWVISYFPKTGKILELGAGHGFDSRFFVSRAYNVVSTDFSETALAYNTTKLPSEYRKKVAIEKLDMSQPFPYKDGSFDVVYAHLTIHYFSDTVTKKLFTEIYRVLKPGGVVALLTNSTSDPEYNTGRKIEEDYFDTANLYKRYFSKDSIQKYASAFTTIVVDDNGETYKDRVKGVGNLIRYIGKK